MGLIKTAFNIVTLGIPAFALAVAKDALVTTNLDTEQEELNQVFDKLARRYGPKEADRLIKEYGM